VAGRAVYSLDATTILSEGLGTLLAGAVAVHGWRAVFLGVVPLLLVSATALGTPGGAALVATGAPPESSRRPQELVPVYVAALALAINASGLGAHAGPGSRSRIVRSFDAGTQLGDGLGIRR
jgi:MFS family permease